MGDDPIVRRTYPDGSSYHGPASREQKALDLSKMFEEMRKNHDPNIPMTPIQLRMQDGFPLPYGALPAFPPGHPLLRKPSTTPK